MKCMSKQDLAMLYFPGISPHAATNQLRVWINQCPGLVKALDEAGYRKNMRLLRGRLVEIIFAYLGEP